MLAFSNNNYELDFGAKQSVELFCAYDERMHLIKLFEIIKDYLLVQIVQSERCGVYSKTLLKTEVLMELEVWIDEKITDFMFCDTELELLKLIIPVLVKYTDNKEIKNICDVGNVYDIVEMWIKGESYINIYEYAQSRCIKIIRRNKEQDILLSEIINMCDSGLGYSATLIVNALAELFVFKYRDAEEVPSMLGSLARKIKYGLYSNEAILFYEIGFCDRVLAQKIEKKLKRVNITSRKKAKKLIKTNRNSVEEVLLEYPSIFFEKLSKI